MSRDKRHVGAHLIHWWKASAFWWRCWNGEWNCSGSLIYSFIHSLDIYLRWLTVFQVPVLNIVNTISFPLEQSSEGKKPLNNFWVAQMVNNLPKMQETWVWSLGQEDPLEKGIATHSSILAWRIPWTDEPGGPLSLGLQKVEQHWATNIFTFRYTWHTSVKCKGKELL